MPDFREVDELTGKVNKVGCKPISQIPWGVEQVRGGTGGDGVIVAVLDTGVNTKHLDLQKKNC